VNTAAVLPLQATFDCFGEQDGFGPHRAGCPSSMQARAKLNGVTMGSEFVLHNGDKGLSIALTGSLAVAVPGGIEAWTAATFAPQWFEDARAQAQGTDQGALRREILFAVAAAECYLLEWVRDEVLKQDYPALDAYFPRNPKVYSAVKEKWKSVPAALVVQGSSRRRLTPAPRPHMPTSAGWSTFAMTWCMDASASRS
jgi:hypothetical protein